VACGAVSNAIMVFMNCCVRSNSWIFHNIIFAPSRADFATFQFLCKLGEYVHVDGLCVEHFPFKIPKPLMTAVYNAIHGRRCHWAYRCISLRGVGALALHSAGLLQSRAKGSRGAVQQSPSFFFRVLFRLLRDVPDVDLVFFNLLHRPVIQMSSTSTSMSAPS